MTDAVAARAPIEAPTTACGAALRAGRSRATCALALRSRAELGVQLLFYVIVVSAVSARRRRPSARCSRRMGPGVLWVAALLASLLSLPRLFAADFADGTLEQIALSP